MEPCRNILVTLLKYFNNLQDVAADSCSFTMYLNLKFQNIHEILYLAFLQVIFCKNAGVLACACQEINTLSHWAAVNLTKNSAPNMLVTYQKEHWLRIPPNTHSKKTCDLNKKCYWDKKKHQKKVIPRLFQNSLNLELL